jgi:hypothetical protein
MRNLTPLLTVTSLLFTAPGHTAALLCDFETQADVTPLRWASQGQSKMERGTAFATTGEAALRFTSPAWKKGMPEWPAFELRPPVRDWTGYDRLVVDITNPNEERYHFALFVSDGKVPIRQGLSYTFKLPERGYLRFVIPLTTFPKTVNRADIALLHFFTQRPGTDLVLHLDNLTLLKAGESLPEPGPAFVQQLVALKVDHLAAVEKVLAKARDTAAGAGAGTQLDVLARRLGEVRAELGSPAITLAQLDALTGELSGLPQRAERLNSIARFQKACAELGQPAGNMLVGIATSMEKILPRDTVFDVKPARELEVSLARNEKESFQVLVLPAAADLRKVSVSVTDLKSSAGEVFKRGQVNCDVMGYVETKARPPYGTSHIGWWPDPILNFLGPVDVKAGDLQSFWIRVRTPRDQAPGVYRGSLAVSAEGVVPQTFPLTVRVRSFTLPTHSPLPVAITFGPHDYPADEKQPLQGEYRNSSEYPVNAWKQHKLAWADMLADYYINYDSLYRHGPPDFDVVKHLHDRGQLVAFNLGIFDAASRGGAAASNTQAGLRTAYDQARALGILDHAYIYGFDECKPEMFPLLEKTAQALRREFPDALLMTTSYDHSYGMDTVAKTMDAWCPLTPSFKPDQAARARAAGKWVWWYICCGPHHPHANMFIEYPAIEGRLLMGAMTAKQRPDGFLYYQISIWNSRKPITGGPFTDWDPRSWTTYHGDGSWTCVGPGGTPLPTIRLENFRDGLEDYAYAVILEAIIRRREANSASLSADGKEWLTEAKAALLPPEALVKSMTDYSREPEKLYAWRNRLGDLIDRSGMADVNPWGLNFGARGFAEGGGDHAATQAIRLFTEQRPDGEFPGWKSFHETPGTRTAEVWKLQPDGALVCKGQPRGYLYTEREYTDFTLQFEWRYPSGTTNSNGGALVRMTGEHAIWPKCLEFQLNQNQAGDFWAIRGYEFTGPAEQMKVMTNASFGILRHVKRQADVEKPAGEWNRFEGSVDGSTVVQKVNGVEVNRATGCDVMPGKILLTSEGQEIHFRNLRLIPKR